MTDNVSLTIKIDPTLKETLKSLALENQISLSQEVCQRLQNSLTAVEHTAVDNQGTAEETDEQLNASELKQIRALLKKSKKKK
ncbi:MULTISPECIES: hypothetical protein [Erwinia]|jgi:hypothetical protein|uniref:Arc-like DNA binding domain-containing protein n=2 Tax=Erwinia billingiae TaxID=182337 RepID=D8MTQ7_ERWBE|nr:MULTISPECIES: hypothetical protein [Erwinia]MBN7120158.1 hypothetical protein [Erwinia billingiae]MCX0500749.1 hypothetical protein [Erwinia billingiae]PRB60397.1 hypothetical protein CQ001_09570 [Erwinia billingiae]QBR52215.1 hypothetical protein E2F51_20525 [Erwinia sp. QL-Z3]QEW31726.1 hypothetical protein D0N50_08580 [Erwinia billingiae]